jgi:DSF synthase
MPDKARLLQIWGSYEQLSVHYDPKQFAVWYTMAPRGRPCFNTDLLAELHRFQGLIREAFRAPGRGLEVPVKYMVLASGVRGVFNLGGDLELFAELIRNHDGDGLLRYATACIDVLYPNAVNFELPLTTISLVQGDALGGGFEAAISSNVVIAEKGAKFGLPEILFNLIPGMGAYSFLIRRTTPAVTRRLMTSGETLSSQEMYDLGLVDVVVDKGEGKAAVKSFIDEHSRRGNAHGALNRIQRLVNSVTYEELMDITRIWVDTALQLTARDLRMIEHLIRAQNRRLRDERGGQKVMESSG